MRIAMGSDHAGYYAKESLKRLLNKDHEIIDMGTSSEEPVDYPDYAAKVAEAVAKGQADRGILICGTGVGMCISANKVHGIRAALCHDEETAKLSRQHNDANVLCMGARVTATRKMEIIMHIWLNTQFEGERHKARVEKMMALEVKQ